MNTFAEPTESSLSRNVAPAEFCRLLVSNRHLHRCDEPARRLRGLRDEEAHTTFVVDELRLQRFLKRDVRP